MKRLDEPFNVLPPNYTVAEPPQTPAPTASTDIENVYLTPENATSDSKLHVSFIWRSL